MHRYIDISFPTSFTRNHFTYHFEQTPEQPEIQPGCRLIAPLNGRPILGYAIKVHDTRPQFKTSGITEIIDPLPLFSPTLVQLAVWISDSCLCAPGEAFHAMLPGGVKQHIVRTVKATATACSRFSEGESLPDALIWLINRDVCPLKTFLAKFPNISRKLQLWLAEELLSIEYESIGENHPKMANLYILSPEGLQDIDACTEKEKLVIQCLLKSNSPLRKHEISKQARVSVSPIERLIKKGILVPKVERIFREAATGAYYAATPSLTSLSLTNEQELVLANIRDNSHEKKRPILIRGVTCSGKTEIYMRWVAEELDHKRGAIILVPEISLTPQIVKRFRDRFGNKVAILHSKLSAGERFDQWEQIRRGARPVVVGARSAVFAPVSSLGTIILDEEGEPSFKQDDPPRYHARDVALKRCELENALLIMGSATPTLDSFQLALKGEYCLTEMNQRVTDRLPPTIEVVDMRRELVAKNNRSMFSEALSKAIVETLSEGNQTILYLNRRGHSSFVFCRVCGQSIDCSKCKISLVYHSSSTILRCHYCGEARSIPKQCPSCTSTAIKFFGAGTQRIEAEAKRYFPQARIQRMDSDTVGPKGNMEEILNAFGNKEIDILIGTQMVAKGLDFPHVTLVGILAADSLLRIPDFRATERNFSLLAQVSGRSGRGGSPGKVVLQTYFPEHFSIKHALSENYRGFFDEEMQHRREGRFPPFFHLAAFLLCSENSQKVREVSQKLAKALSEHSELKTQEILGPAPAPIERINNQFRFRLLVKSTDLISMTSAIREVLDQFPTSGIKLSVDIDPIFSL